MNVTFASGTGMPGLSTDQTALNVNRFIAQRTAMTSRPETSAQRRSTAGAPVPPELLYPSLYAERFSLLQRCSNYLHAVVINASNQLYAREKRSSTFVSSAKE